MTVVWTDEMRAKAAATRAETKRKKEERERKKLEKSSKIGQEAEVMPNEARAAVIQTKVVTGDHRAETSDVFDLEKSPLTEIINRQAQMKNEYERISQIVLRRMNPDGKRWMCFTEEQRQLGNQKAIPKPVLVNCVKTGDDGKWKFRDDGRFVIVNGVRTLRPAFCCNSGCFAYYQQSRSFQPR